MSVLTPRPSYLTATLVTGLLLAGLADLQAQRLALAPVLELGAPDGPEHTVWQRITDATIVSGRVFVVDIALPSVRAFEFNGSFVAELGGVGQGPSEYVRPISVSVRRDTVTVLDMTGRWVQYRPDGRHIRTRRLPARPSPGYFERIWVLRGDILVGKTLTVGRANPDESISDIYTLSWRSVSAVDTLLSVSSDPIWVEWERGDQPAMLTTLSWGPAGGSWVVGDSIVATLDAEQGVVRAEGFGLDLARTLELPERNRYVLERTDRTLAEDWVNDWFGRTLGDRIHRVEQPSSLSPWIDLRAGDAGHLWVREGGVEIIDPQLGQRWLRLSLDDDSVAEVVLPPGVQALRFREGHVVGKSRGAFGEETLVLYRIEG